MRTPTLGLSNWIFWREKPRNLHLPLYLHGILRHPTAGQLRTSLHLETSFQVAPGENSVLSPTAVALGSRRPRPQDHASCDKRRHLLIKSAYITLPARHPAHSLCLSRSRRSRCQEGIRCAKMLLEKGRVCQGLEGPGGCQVSLAPGRTTRFSGQHAQVIEDKRQTIFFSTNLCCATLGTYIRYELFVVCLKFPFSWTSCILSGSPNS